MEIVMEQCVLTPSESENKNAEFSPVKIRVAYVGKNRNKRCISKCVMDSMIPSLYNVPIVGHWREDAGNFGEHDVEIIKSGNKIEVKDLTRPYGVVPSDAEVWYEDVKEDDGTEHTYLCCTGLLWTARYPEASKIISEASNQSMEIRVYEKTDWPDGDGYDITKAEFSALCILGRSDNPDENMTPCFESASIEGYSFKTEFDEMIKHLRPNEEVASVKNDELENDEDHSGLESVDTFALTVSTIRDRLEAFYRAFDKRGTRDTYYYFNDADDKYAYAEKCERDHDCLNVRVAYTEVDREIILANEEEPVIRRWITESEAALVDEENARKETELSSLRKYRAQREAEDVFAEFGDLENVEEFKALKGEYTKYDVDMLRTLCYAIRGKSVVVKPETIVTKVPAVSVDDDDENDPYGGIIKPHKN